MTKDSKDVKQTIINRLRRIEGQVRGLEKMIDSERDCADILTLFSGVSSALNSTRDIVLENYLEQCVSDKENLEISELIKVLKLSR